MTDENRRDGRRIVRKDLGDLDRTDGFATGHGSWREVAEACHATDGQDHE